MYLVSKSSNYNETIALNLKVLCEASELLLDQLCLLEHIGGEQVLGQVLAAEHLGHVCVKIVELGLELG